MSAPIPVLDRGDAPAEALPPLDALQAAFGFTPNLALAMAHAPSALAAYVTGLQSAGSSLSPAEAQLVMLAASRANRAPYGVAVHRALALQTGAPADAVAAAEDASDDIADPRVRGLLRMARAVTERRALAAVDVDGFTPGELVELAYAVSLKQFANVVATLSAAPIDPPLLTGRNA